MAKPELGTKRTCPETGRNFYDLDKDPIVSPYSGKEYPISFFEGEEDIKPPKPEPVKEPEKAETKSEEETTEEDGVEVISLEDADDEAGVNGDDDKDDDDDENDEMADLPELPEDVDIDDDEEAEDDGKTFLDDDEEDTDLSGVIGTADQDDKADT